MQKHSIIFKPSGTKSLLTCTHKSKDKNDGKSECIYFFGAKVSFLTFQMHFPRVNSGNID